MRERHYVGGQALIEGVLMKYRNKVAIAVRRKNNKIHVKKEELGLKENYVPFIRGIVNLFIILYTGIKALNYSGNMQLEKKEKISTAGIVGSMIIALLFALLLFKFIPLLTASLLNKYYTINNLYFNLIDGTVKIFLFVGYVYVISFNNDVKRVFQYHGAEHKAVACYEHNKKLTVNNVQKFSTLHKRCGTTFIFLVLLLSIVVYMFIPKDYDFFTKLGLRIVLLPVIASLSYELLRLGAKFSLLKILVFPGLLIQKITTKEPDDSQVEVAIAAINGVIK